MEHQRESSIFTKKDLGLAKIAGPARKSRVVPLRNYTDDDDNSILGNDQSETKACVDRTDEDIMINRQQQYDEQ